MKKIKNIIFLGVIAFVSQANCADSAVKKSAMIYNPAGKRDPFRVLAMAPVGRKVSNIYPTEKYDLDQLNLRAILRMGGKSRALIEAPDGLTFIVNEGEIVGRERATLSRVLKTEIILTQQTFNYLGSPSLVEKIISLPPENPGLILESSSEKSVEKTGASRTKSSKSKVRKPARSESSRELQQDSTGLEGAPGGVAEDVKKVLDRPAQLEKDLDEIMGNKTQ